MVYIAQYVSSALTGLVLKVRVWVRFSEKGKQMIKKGKIFENLVKNVQNLNIFWKRAGDFML